MMAKPVPVDPQILLLFKYAEQVQALHPDHPISSNLPDLYVTGETHKDRVKKYNLCTALSYVLIFFMIVEY